MQLGAKGKKIDSSTKVSVRQHYQGARSRREIRFVIALFVSTLLIVPNIAQVRSFEHRVTSFALAIAVFIISDYLFSRRMGLIIEKNGLVLRYAFYRKRILWSNIAGFEWRRWRDPRSEVLWLKASDGSRPRRIPTVARISKGWWARHLGSSNIRSRTGEEVNAVAALEDALAAARH
jgi:hypothetical protein